MVNVNLHGKLGVEFSPFWSLDVKTPEEAIRALNANTGGAFSSYLTKSMKEKGVAYQIFVNGEAIVKENMKDVMGGPCVNEEVDFVPVVSGAYGAEYWVPALIAILTAAVSYMLQPGIPKIDLGGNSEEARKDSYLFSGGPQPARQGKPIPVGYGRMLVYPIVGSATYNYTNMIETATA